VQTERRGFLVDKPAKAHSLHAAFYEVIAYHATPVFQRTRRPCKRDLPSGRPPLGQKNVCRWSQCVVGDRWRFLRHLKQVLPLWIALNVDLHKAALRVHLEVPLAGVAEGRGGEFVGEAAMLDRGRYFCVVETMMLPLRR
jgi:hypothetical protein